MDKINERIKILYGSETGNAQDFAEEIHKKCRTNCIQAECLAFDNYSIQNLCGEKTAIFIVSTSGQGEMPTNMRKNWQFLLSKKLPEKTWLSNTKIAVLGLGDSSYQKYNYAAKKVYRRLVQLGAQPILDLSLADEQHRLGIDEIFEKWQNELMETEPFKSSDNKICSNIPNYDLIYNVGESSNYFPLELIENERLTAEKHFQETRLITFSSIDNLNNFGYSPGDVLMVLPENLDETIEIVKNCLKSCEKYFDYPISSICNLDPFISRVPQFIRIKAETTLLECLQFYFDFQCIPKRKFIKQMARHALDGMEKERLVELSSSEGIDDYLNYCVHSRRTTVELLRDFPETSSSLTPNDLFEFFPVIRPRGFSITSSPIAHQNKIQILVVRVEYMVRKMKAARLGLCSNFLCASKTGRKVFLRIRSGVFLHKNKEEPLILIGPGTGVAPFRSFISQNELTNPGCKILLFFGCRSEFQDFYFRDEWLKYSKTQIVTAFSRDQDKKVYVQHKIVRNGKEIFELLNQGARIFIAGASGDMPKQVIAALKNVLIGFGKISFEEAEKQIELMEKKKWIQYETWC